MTSIRKTKKQLKQRLREKMTEKKRIGDLPACWHNLFLYEAVAHDIELLKQELQKLKRKKI